MPVGEEPTVVRDDLALLASLTGAGRGDCHQVSKRKTGMIRP
jgi:hypothetical protein